MSSPIDPVRRTNLVRRAQRPRTADREEAQEAADRGVPAIYDSAPSPPPGGSTESASTFNAHLMGQDGQKRGLRGGQPVIDKARAAYLETEFSGPDDRRPPKGLIRKTEI